MQQEVQGIVEIARVRAFGLDDRKELFQVVSEQLAAHHALAGEHPVLVAAERVDFPVVGHVAVRMGAVPTRKRVRREPRVDHRQVAAILGILQVGIKRHQLRGREHALVDDDPRRQRADVKHQRLRKLAHAQNAAGPLADHIELAIERLGIQTVGRGDKHLLHRRLGGPCRRTDVGRLRPRRQGPPAQQVLALLGDDLLELRLAFRALAFVGRQEDVADAVQAGFGQLHAEVGLGRDLQKLVRQGGEHAGAVSRVRFAARRAAMHQVAQNAIRVVDDLA